MAFGCPAQFDPTLKLPRARGPVGMPTLEALATGTPDNRLTQATAQQLAEGVVDEQAPELAEVLPVFENAGIQQRSLARPLDWYLSSPGWSQRAEAYEQAGGDLALEVARDCLEQAEVPPAAVDGIVFVNTTGLATPSLETQLANRLGLRAEVLRVPVWGLGCAGGVAGLARASDLARSRPEGRFLLVALELCSLAFLREELSKKLVVAAALFGDGAAAGLVAGDEVQTTGPRVRASASHLWPDTEDVMGWDVRDAGLDVVFSPQIPEIVEHRLGDVVQSFAKRHGVDVAQARSPFHPGGPKVLAAYEAALELGPDALATSRRILAEHGNMSSPTALFALEASLAQASLPPGEDALLAAVGPGFAAELALVTGA